MSNDSTIKELLERNKHIAATHEPIPLLSEMPSMGLKLLKTLIITCADPRCVPETFLGLKPLEAASMRNICGHVGHAMNDILALDHLASLSTILIIHHTDCGALVFTDAAVGEAIKARVPSAENLDHESYGAITNVEQSVKDDLAILKGSPLIRKELAEHSYGFVFDIKTGLLSPVDA